MGSAVDPKFAKGVFNAVSRLASAASAATSEAARSGYSYLKGDKGEREAVRELHLCWIRWEDSDSPGRSWSRGGRPLPALLVAYASGWQLWSLDAPAQRVPTEIISQRDTSFR